MSRFTECFKKAANEQRPAYIPFLMLGDPTPELSLRIIDEVIASGIDAIELGIPFSDPIADGPIVSLAANRACQHHLTTHQYLTLISRIREKHPSLPIGILVYANLVFRYEYDTFYRQAKAFGVDGVLIPDLPFIEAMPYLQSAKQHAIDAIMLATPACPPSSLKHVAEYGSGFTYLVTRPGVTGVERESQFEMTQQKVQQLDTLNAPPCVFGFGIKNALDVARAYQAGAKGVIIGSALIDAIQKQLLTRNPGSISDLTRSLFMG
ncbi:tryptophan synthase subunit alpha [Candidatus Berkiella aquae]|uniref:Tryptophan synthase alpha chain n=1 Tax=Candidatus Berkiella aquae TaxID=295108 RepID=A0A0Q9YKP1_9GAMM|nr:tryptophan synthase subunit alpha [Candidatus Berkiella aquae]MCS5710875.1 tryptophan synthase subunit alpha [Candidatus Berkiella aquae]